MSENYIKNHFDDIKAFANIIENRLDDDCTLEGLLEDNKWYLEQAEKHNVNYVLIDDDYHKPLVRILQQLYTRGVGASLKRIREILESSDSDTQNSVE